MVQARTSGTVTAQAGGGFGVSGTHTYKEYGTFQVNVTITEQESGGATVTGSTLAEVADAPLSASPTDISAIENVAANNVSVATFTDANPYGQPGDFAVTIDWGDGTTPTSGTVTGSPSAFTVLGSHTYAESGTTPSA